MPLLKPQPLHSSHRVYLERLEDIGPHDSDVPSSSKVVESRSDRAGDTAPILVSWDSPDDPANPKNWPLWRKNLVTAICCILGMNVTFTSSVPATTYGFVTSEFGVPLETAYLLISVCMAGYVFGPLLWGPGSELYGRRPVFIVTMGMSTLLHLGQSLACNMTTLLVTRFIGSVFGIAPLSNCGGVIADIWGPAQRGLAMSVFMHSVFLGATTLGPIMGGLVVENLGWRWVFWVMTIYAGSCTVIVAIALPETFAPILLREKASAQRLRGADPVRYQSAYAAHEKEDWSFMGIVHQVFRPFRMLAMEPILVLITAYLSLVYGILYALFEAMPVIFVAKRGLSVVNTGFIFAGAGIGCTIGAMVCGYIDRRQVDLITKWDGSPPPERRLYGAMAAGPCLVIGIFWLGWSGQYPMVPWYVPALSMIPIGASITLSFISFFSYVIDTYLMYSASALAGHTVIRSIFAIAFPLFTVQMFTKMGSNWAATLLGLIGLVLTPSPFLFFKYGARIRAKSRFAPCKDSTKTVNYKDMNDGSGIGFEQQREETLNNDIF
ncbi:MFS general substrate transporter [Leucogyrophana mollusca]|uniref:MFS general substrate transporter n=1 Tax=Leucogyrophana mollusca TaxID=85980 RepID=A0ACB8BVI2_9AGAM|nr:MFS general substrate transporter [Leucogyrophana mollusca]